MHRRTKEEVIEEIRSVSQSLDTEVLTQKQFFSNSNITISDIYRHFPKWSDACAAAGVAYDRSREKLSDEDLLSDWGRVARTFGKIPTLTEYKVEGKHDRKPFDRFGKWVDVPQAFGEFFADSGEWQDILEIVRTASPRRKKAVAVPKSRIDHKTIKPQRHQKLTGRPTYGDPIDFRGLRHAPVNEQGVVFLFGIVARELGFSVEGVQSGFPDCKAKVEISPGKWMDVDIEFEYLSRNFAEHGHDADSCDYIVCWEHNWQECPEHLCVIALSEEIKSLRKK